MHLPKYIRVINVIKRTDNTVSNIFFVVINNTPIPIKITNNLSNKFKKYV